jgi:hypothetical protein
MKNSEYEIYIVSNDEWTQIRPMTSDQLLSHILPLLVEGEKKI